ncbi:ankyrin repeat domain-containing protein [Cerasicoccus frondis]|uniref:ankyrin repeat domain-containing protein n=1 Tax=Cerasicoccus frondis TaxID=490090 RepID=UPI002852551F|nr:ankyrin repeat domain-containing protein [Cerasicoccus frondis]
MNKKIPSRPNLEFDRKQAKALLKQVRAGESAAVQRLAESHPRPTVPEPKLADAQLVIAREYGFKSWPQWRTFVETRNLSRREQAAEALRAICSNDVRRARVLLDAEPRLAQEDFYLACACGEVNFVRRQLAEKPELVFTEGGALGQLPLEYVCFSRLFRSEPERAPALAEVGQMLIEAGVASGRPLADFMEPVGRDTPLYGAAGIANHAGLTRLLLEAGADPDEGEPEPDPSDPHKTPWGTEALYHASEFADTACLELLLKAKPHPIRVSYCLGRALDFDNPAAVKLYLEHGADLNFTYHLTFLQKAVRYNRSAEVVRLLLEGGADPHAEDPRGLTAIRWAARRNREDLVALLAEHGATGVTEEDRLLGQLFAGEEVAFADEVPAELLSEATRINNVPAIRALVAAGADIDAVVRGIDNMPILHQACWRGHFEAASVLIELGADVHQLNSYGGDALGTTVFGSEHCHDINGGNTMRLPEENTPRGYAKIVALLLDHGAPLPSKIEHGSEPIRELLRRHGVPDPE